MRRALRYRRECCDALELAGPDAPTLCEGWVTRDLAIHLVLRERRPDALASSMLKPLTRYARWVEQRYAARPYDELITMIRQGMLVTPLKIPPLDELMNVVEFFVHTQDVLRADPAWTPTGEALSTADEDVFWGRLKTMGRLLCRHAPTGIELVRTDVGQDDRLRVHVPTRLGYVRVSGPPSELLLFCFGRTGVAQVTLEGSQEAQDALRQGSLGF